MSFSCKKGDFNLTGVSTGLTGRSKNLDPTGNPTGAGRPDRFPSLLRTKRTVPIGTVIFMCNLRPSMKIRLTQRAQLQTHNIFKK